MRKLDRIMVQAFAQGAPHIDDGGNLGGHRGIVPSAVSRGDIRFRGIVFFERHRIRLHSAMLRGIDGSIYDIRIFLWLGGIVPDAWRDIV